MYRSKRIDGSGQVIANPSAMIKDRLSYLPILHSLQERYSNLRKEGEEVECSLSLSLLSPPPSKQEKEGFSKTCSKISKVKEKDLHIKVTSILDLTI
ncbi:hypothetical protein KFK09_000769 [Dendrobium nobile]|uniref:Uncharacterized protein n=1 Tax=Dendrobium nobile TaxID=94219 RepID=A0A8T3CC07_DENNO|nr:hypothetical protein KFK09_000769 [Dendrobium nobile]